MTQEVSTQVPTKDLKPGSVVSGLSRNGNRYGVESVKRARFSEWGRPPRGSFVVTLALPGTRGAVTAVRCSQDDIWYVWKEES